ncbi:Ff.00g035160.m01.CDS01 [Fusarium sp. VM40]|nr:Ff.00g035160.m01.CDS01 [Fusarium sp. VM40]
MPSVLSLTDDSQCDLGRPLCGRCFKKKKDCEFLSSITPSTVDDPKSLATLTPTEETILAPRASISEVETLPWEDLELLQHFSTVTYTTLANRHDLLQMWQIQIPKMAMKQKFLMHILFSVISLHITSSRPENASAYTDRAIRHNNIALREYRSKLHSITPENSPSLFACSTLLIIAALRLSASGPHQEPVGAIEEIAGIFILAQGVRSVLSEMRNWIRESEIAPLFVGRELDDNIILPKDVADVLGLLETCNQQSADLDSDKTAYVLAIQGLKACFTHLRSKERDNGIVLSWAVDVNQDYIRLLGLRRPMALVILAYFAVALEEVKEAWWADGWGSRLIQEVSQALGVKWKALMAWPMDRITVGNSNE